MKPYYQDELSVLYCGDNREIMLHLPGFDLLCTDPPYGIGEAKKKKSESRIRATKIYRKPKAINYKDHSWDDVPATKEQIQQARALAKWQIIFGGNYFELPPSRCWLVWDKLNSGDFADCELAWTNFNKAIRRLAYLWNGMIKAKPEDRYHPTQKPFDVMKWVIKQAPDDVISVIDPWCGSGTTLCAAKSMGLMSTGIELDEAMCEIAAKRLSVTFEGSEKASISNPKSPAATLF